MKMDRLIKALIVEAQNASDAAKASYYTNDRYYFYHLKQSLLDKAVSILENIKHSRIQFRVVSDLDQNGCPSFVYYFEWKENGNTIQFSFHSFKYNKNRGNKTITWDHGDCNYNASLFKKGIYTSKGGDA